MYKTLCIIQARMGSSRFPGKVLIIAAGVPLLEYQVRRVRNSKYIDKIVLATSTKSENDPIAVLCRKIGIDCYRGLEEDVLGRFYTCSLKYPDYDTIVRLTGDCPLVDPHLIDEFAVYFRKGKFDFVNPSRGLDRETFPEGVAEIEVFSRNALKTAYQKAQDPLEREHVTLYFTRHPRAFKKGTVELPENSLARYRLTVDDPVDLEVIKYVIEHSQVTDGYRQLISILKKNPEVASRNMHVVRNEGLKKNLIGQNYQ